MAIKIKKNDTVKIISGKDRGKTGKVINVDSRNRKITVENINLFKKRVRPKANGQKGETVMVARPFIVSKAMLVCPNCKQATRVGYSKEGDAKLRYCKKCSSRI
ncbi:50S ribosomal protein L24 [Patescibacteria group bacterium]|nr:50S ribosomal protein L24 [Patescibacteria group bacterium]MCL5733487.1 50S ribosomal protein L24 [Patescibacteria group bacterium]